jgi:uncharacterized membrane protein
MCLWFEFICQINSKLNISELEANHKQCKRITVVLEKVARRIPDDYNVRLHAMSSERVA